MSVGVDVSVLSFKSHEGVRDEEDDIPAFLRRRASVPPQPLKRPPRTLSPRFVLLVFASGYCLSYVYRTIPALLSEPLVKELGLTPGNLGVLTAAFFFSTAALQLPIGVWLDRYGPRRVQGLLMFSAVIGAAIFALADNIVLLTLARACIGIGAAGGFMAGLKAIALRFPPERVALANSWLVMLGSFGACLASWPAAVMIAEIGWRGLFFLLAGLTAASALAILTLVPERRPQQRNAARTQAASILAIYRDARFWRLAPLSALFVGSSWALQGLWAAPWFSTVEAFDRQTIVTYLFLMAASLAPSALLLGAAVHRLHRRGISSARMLALVTALGMSAELALILRLPVPPLLPWLVIAGVSTITVLSFAVLGQIFSASGRANAALNLLHLGTAFLVQSGIGLLIGQWPPIDGQSPAIAYQSAFAVVLAAQFMSWCIFVRPRCIRVSDHLHAHPLHGLARELGLPAAMTMPYLRARRIWTDRFLDAKNQCRSWRRAGLASLAVTGSLALWVIWTARQDTSVPYIVTVANLHEPGEIWSIAPGLLVTGTVPEARLTNQREGQTDGRAPR
jgi:predicted MFS family arabinose efflux permease